ncbi:UNVERIFIED_CONTAM: hypothetical protein FKN15_060794 [Acipenser sinensis]
MEYQLSVLQEQPRKDASDSAPVLLEPPSCPGTPSPLSKLAAGTSSAGTLKRPTALSRHASAAGFPMQAAGTWGFSKGHRGALSYSPTAESGEGTIIEVEDIAQLLRHVARFAESVEKLKDVVLGEEEAEATYRTCIADAKTQKQELEDVKVNVLRQLQEVIKQSDQTLRSATISYYQIMHMQTAPLPVHYQTLCINGIEPEIVVPTGPFRNIGLSKAAQTHRLRKLRTPSKCRECDSYVYFQGAECEECFLACHKKCLETLAIQCGHKKLQGKLQLFGRDFTQTSRDSPEGIPFIIKKCISEIEKRALKMKLPEPIIPFRLYNDMMGLAKESLQGAGGPDGEAAKGPELVDLGPDTDKEVLASVHKLCELLKQLPAPNIATLQYITRHLRKISEVEVDNKMSSSNLGIVFGPTLMRPRPTGATVSLSSLVDYPHQARIIETLIVFYETIFEPGTSSSSRTCSQDSATEESPELGEEGAEEQCPVDSDDRAEETCRNSLGSSGSRECSLDSDSEDEIPPPCLTKQESETSTEQLCEPIGDENHESDSEVTEDEGQDRNRSLAEHNTNQSNNTLVSPAPLPTARLKRGKLEVCCSEEREPEFV